MAIETKRIVNDIRAAAAGTGLDHPKAHVSWSPLELDREGYDEVAELLGGVLEKLHDIQARVSRPAGREGREEGRDAVDGGRDSALRAPAPCQTTAGAQVALASDGPYFSWPMRMWLPNGSRRPQSVP